MRSAAWREYTDRVREAIDFPALVEETTEPLPRRPRGRAVLVHCPWHADRKTPSLAVYEDHATCFGACGETWDVFGWLMKRDGLTFPQAREELAQRANISKPQWTPGQERAAQERRAYEDALGLAARHFASHLQETPAMLAYARGRAWPDEVIRSEGLGYADGGPLPNLGNDQAGRVIEALNRWAGKVGGAIVYVHRDGGRVVYLAGRSIENKAHYNPPRDLAGPKQPYCNGSYSARAEEVITVEGQADAVTLSGWGGPALALAGSGLTGDLAACLERHVERGAAIYVVPDGDGKTDVTGLAAAVGPLLRVVTLGEDVADVNAWAQEGVTVEGFRERLDAAPTWLALEVERTAQIEGCERRDALRTLFGHLTTLDPFALADYRERVIEALGINPSQFNYYLKAAQGEVTAKRRNGRNGDRYVVEGGCLCAVRYGRDGDRYAEPLCNFTAEVIEDVAHDDGEEVTRQFTVTGRLEDGTRLPIRQMYRHDTN